MTVKIIKATKSTYWYAKYIGETFKVDSYSSVDKEYVVRMVPHGVPWSEAINHYIVADDCVLVSGSIECNKHGDSKLRFYFV